jgi:hypothetical protein
MYSRAVHSFGGYSSRAGVGRIRICQSRQRKGDPYDPCGERLELESFRFGVIKSVGVGLISMCRVERRDVNVTSSDDKVVGYRGKCPRIIALSKGGSPSKIPIKEAIKTVYDPRKVMN